MADKRTRSITTKVSEEQYARFQELAGTETVSEWMRRVLFEQGERHAPAPVQPPAAPTLRVVPRSTPEPAVAPPLRLAPRSATPGRSSTAGRWMPRRPVWTLAALALALGTTYAVADAQYSRQWSDVQRSMWRAYVMSTIGEQMAWAPKPYVLPSGTRGVYDHGPMREYLRASVYGGQSVVQMARDPLLAGLVVLLLGLLVAVPKDRAMRRARRLGRVIKGPELVDAAGFNRVVRGDGLEIRQEHGPAFRIPLAAEPTHLSISGGTGSGKTTLIRQALVQIRDRDETAVVFDLPGEFAGQFYDPARGDVILNPYDARFPGWAIGAEVEKEAEAMAIASALFTSRKHGDDFFREVPRRIFAHLLTRTPRPTAADLVFWLADEAVLDQVLKSTSEGKRFAAMIPKAAYHQHGGIMAELNIVGDALSTLPPETPESWSAAAWSQHRRGWIFITGSPATRDRLLPLMTLWLDLLILRLMQRNGPERKTWILIDELASLGKLPQLQTALTQSRKSYVPIVLGFQSSSQIEAIYGPVWKGMLAQPATNVVLRTTEPESAKWQAALLGDVVRERIRETRTKHGRKWSRSEAMTQETEPLVMPSQIGGLPPRAGYVKYENTVGQIGQLAIPSLPAVAEAFVEREMIAWEAAHG